MSKFAEGQQVRVTKIHAHYPGGSTVPGDIGTVERWESCYGESTCVRMETGKFAGDIRIIEDNRLELYEPNKGYVLLREESSATPLDMQYADLEAALTWLRENRINGRFEVLYVNKGDTYEASHVVTRV
ncbi:hypothetical protein [Burkholderia cenocepacia]|uniref:hypothetical protein n=1 Tax=Burkholderia cenocepacia TaxID=95486 RepID=UPI0024B65252|nr:hypothetical protein [Burkholderia cenocepacia]MDI9686579.1 hypothetical protein [Burkholderia cenocepacia]